MDFATSSKVNPIVQPQSHFETISTNLYDTPHP